MIECMGVLRKETDAPKKRIKSKIRCKLKLSQSDRLENRFIYPSKFIKVARLMFSIITRNLRKIFSRL